MKTQSDILKIQGKFRIFKEGKLIAESPNVVTKAAKDAILRALGQVSGGGDEVGSSFYIQHIAYGKQLAIPPSPDTWFNAALTSIGTVTGDSNVATPPVAIVAGPTSASVTCEADYTNGSGSTVELDFMAAINTTGSYIASNVLAVSGLGSSIFVLNGETITIQYQMIFLYT